MCNAPKSTSPDSKALFKHHSVLPQKVLLMFCLPEAVASVAACHVWDVQSLWHWLHSLHRPVFAHTPTMFVHCYCRQLRCCLIPARSASMMQNRLPLPTSPANLLPLLADPKSKALSYVPVSQSCSCCIPNFWIGIVYQTLDYAIEHVCHVILFLVLQFCHVVGMMVPLSLGFVVRLLQVRVLCE